LKRDTPAMECMLASVAKLHVRGVAVQWELLGIDGVSHHSFPGYPWQRQHFWAESEDARAVRLSGPAHPLLGTRGRGANPAWLSEDAFPGIPRIRVPVEEPWGANVVRIGNHVVASSGFPRTIDLIQSHGFTVHPVDLSEFAKAEGGVTCLSLLVG
jgi:hypothetical protein